MSSCVSTKFLNVTECSISKEKVILKLKEQKVAAKAVAVSNHTKDFGKCSVFNLTIDKWEGVKTNLNEVSIPVLQVGGDIFVNAFFLNGELRDGFDYQLSMQSIDNAIKAFRSENGSSFEEATLKDVENFYKRGVSIFPKGRLWMNKLSIHNLD